MSTVPATAQFSLAPLTPGSEDLYSNLASFTFGTAATSQRTGSLDTVSPFSTTSGTSSSDRTPRPSVSGRTRTPRSRSRNLEDDGSRADDEDEEEAARQSRAKMRAIDDGTRRPSLPVNSYNPGRTVSDPAPSPKAADKTRAQRSPSVERDADHEESDIAEEGGDLDTDVEFDYVHRGGSQDPEMSDAASHRTFGPPSGIRMNIDGESDRSSQRSVSPVRFSATYDSDSVESSVVISEQQQQQQQQRRGSVPWAIPGVPQDGSVTRNREDSIATVIMPGRRMSRSLGNDEHPLGQLNLAAQSTSQPSTRADWRTLEAQSRTLQNEQELAEQTASPVDDEEAGRQVYKALGLDMSYVFDGSAARKSWSSDAPSYVQQGNQGAQRGPTSTWEFPAGWGLSMGGGGGGRRPSVMTVTTISGEDAFHRATNMYDPAYAARKEAWSFKCEQMNALSQGSSTAMIPTATRSTSRSTGSRVGYQEVWKQDYVGCFKTDRLVIQR